MQNAQAPVATALSLAIVARALEIQRLRPLPSSPELSGCDSSAAQAALPRPLAARPSQLTMTGESKGYPEAFNLSLIGNDAVKVGHPSDKRC